MENSDNNTYSALLLLVRAALWGDAASIYNMEIDWEKVYEEMKSQAVSCIVADLLNDEAIKVPDSVRSDWAMRAGDGIFSFYKILDAQDKALSLLDSQGIPAVVLKGTVAASNYPSPEYRTMGDIDLLVPEQCFDKALNCLFENGYQPENEYNTSVDARLNQKHVEVVKDGIFLELHLRAFIVPDKEIDKKLNSYMDEGLKSIEYIRLCDYRVPTLPMLQNALEYIIHTQNHLCDSGLGLRHILDWMLFAKNNLTDEVYQREVQGVFREAGLEEFAKVLTRMCQIYLGLPEDGFQWCIGADEQTCADLLDYIFYKGNFGRKVRDDKGAGALTRLRNPKEFFRAIQIGGLNHYPWLRERKILRHFAWAFQLGRYVAYVFMKNKKLTSDIKKSRSRIDLLQRLKLFKTK